MEKNDIIGKMDWKGRPANKNKHGGMCVASLILGTYACENMAIVSLLVNGVLYFNLVMHFSIADSANQVTIFTGTGYLLTVLMGFLADAYIGRYKIILLSTCLECMGLCLLTLQAHYEQLKPPPCNIFDPKAHCARVNGVNAMLFFFGLYFIAIGVAGVKVALPSHGADQFEDDDPKEMQQKSTFFNLAYVAMCLGSAISLTLFVYVEDHKGWDKGLGLSTLAMFFGVLLLICGFKQHRLYEVQGSSAVTEIIQVYVAAIYNRKLALPDDSSKLYEIDRDKRAEVEEDLLPHTDDYRFLDKAAIRPSTMEGEDWNPWKLCTVTQVENAKIILRMMPVFGCAITMGLCLAQLDTFSVQQGNTMDTRIGSFNMPPASIPIIPLLFTVIALPMYDQIVVPFIRRFTGHPTGLTYLQRVGVGLALCVLSMAVGALVEVKRKGVARKHNMLDAIPVLQPLSISIFWMVLQYFIYGIADMFTYVGLLEFFYSQAPKSLKSFSSSFLYLACGLGYFLSSILVKIVNHATKNTKTGGWLAGNNLNKNHLDLFYWLLTILCLLNFLVYLVVAMRYKYRTVKNVSTVTVQYCSLRSPIRTNQSFEPAMNYFVPRVEEKGSFINSFPFVSLTHFNQKVPI